MKPYITTGYYNGILLPDLYTIEQVKEYALKAIAESNKGIVVGFQNAIEIIEIGSVDNLSL